MISHAEGSISSVTQKSQLHRGFPVSQADSPSASVIERKEIFVRQLKRGISASNTEVAALFPGP